MQCVVFSAHDKSKIIVLSVLYTVFADRNMISELGVMLSQNYSEMTVMYFVICCTSTLGLRHISVNITKLNHIQ